MKSTVSNKLSVQLFAGYYLSPEIRRNLHENKEWEEAKIKWQSEKNGLQIIPYQSKEYLGSYLEKETLTLGEIRKTEENIRKLLLECCPRLQENTLDLVIFPQVFIC